MTLSMARVRRITQLNLEPLNAAAGKHLPRSYDRSSGLELNLITLARLGLEARVGRFRDPDDEELEVALNHLTSADPDWALEYMSTDESEEPLLTPEALSGVDRGTAMFRVLEALHDSKASR